MCTVKAVYALESVCAANYGLAGRAYITKVVGNKVSAIDFVRKMVARFVKDCGATGTSETRYAQRFGLAYAGLKLATRYGIIKLPENAAWKAIRLCYRRARASAPTFPHMLDKAYGQLRAALFEREGIIDLSNPNRTTTKSKFDDCSGVILTHETHGKFYAIKIEELQSLSESTLSARQILDYLKRHGLLILVKGGKSTVPITIPGIGKADRQRLVCIKHSELQLHPPTSQSES